MSDSSQATCSRVSTSPIASCFNDAVPPSSPKRPLEVFLRRFDPRRRLEHPGTNYQLPVFSHRREISDGDDRGVLVSKEIKSESTVA